MLFHFRDQFPKLNIFWERYLPFQKKLEVPAKTVLLEEGKISNNYIFIEQGCVRAFFGSNDGDKTVQFFFEQSGLASFDSFVNDVPSLFTLETLEPSVLFLLPKNYVMQLIDELSHEADFIQMILKVSAQRQTHYISEFVSFIRDTPEDRYQQLLAQKPHIVQRVAQHYIASYLGISTVHLSRIRSKVAKSKAHF